MANDTTDDFLSGKGSAPPASSTTAPPPDSTDVFLGGTTAPPASVDPTTDFLGKGSPAMRAWRSYQAAGSLHNWLAPAPGTEYGNVVPYARDTATGDIRLALPNMLRLPLYGATEPIQDAATVDPTTGTFGVTPEVGAAVQAFGGKPLGFGSPISGTSLIEREAPLSPEFKANALSPEALAAAKAPPAGPTTPTGIEPPKVPAFAPPAPTSTPTTSAQAKQIASAYYDIANSSGSVLTPKFTNSFIDSVEAKIPQTEAGQVVGGQTPLGALVDRLQTLRDKPMTLQAAQEVDEALGGLIDKEYGVKGLSKDGKDLLDVQNSFRDQIADAGPDDITGGSAGFDALGPARKAWSQAMKMDDLERISGRAARTDNPASSIKSQLNTLLSNRSKSRGYDDDETAALEDAAKRGMLGGALHVFGSRLIPLGAGLAEAGTHGLTAGLAAATVSHFGAAKLRDWAATLQENRLRNALDVLGQGVPDNPLNMPPP